MNAALSVRSVRGRQDPKLIARLAAAAHAIRTLSIAAIHHAGSGHPGRALSVADVLAALYGAEMNLWPAHLDDPDRDRLVLSDADAAPALYAAGAHFGFCTADDALRLHKRSAEMPWADAGRDRSISVALGMAQGLKLKKSPARVYAMLGSSELRAAAACASHGGVDNFVAIADYDDSGANVVGLETKFRASGWEVIEIDGHDLDVIVSAFEKAFEVAGKPVVILAHTLKGKGVLFMEDVPDWNGDVMLSRQQAEDALKALGCGAQDFARLLDLRKVETR